MHLPITPPHLEKSIVSHSFRIIFLLDIIVFQIVFTTFVRIKSTNNISNTNIIPP